MFIRNRLTTFTFNNRDITSSYHFLYKNFSKTKSSSKAPNLDSVLTAEDKSKLKKANIPLRELPHFTPEKLSHLSGLSVAKCEKITTLSKFQTLHGVSIQASLDLWDLGYRDLNQLSTANPKLLYDKMLKKKKPQDPCVEDTFRSAVAQSIAFTKYNASLPKSDSQWWRWGSMRGKGVKEIEAKVKNVLNNKENLQSLHHQEEPKKKPK